MQVDRAVGEPTGPVHELPGAVGELAGAVDQVARAVVEVARTVGELGGAVGRVHDPVVDRREADVDLVEVLLEDRGAQRVRERGADGLGEVAADVVDRVVRGHGDHRGRRVHRVAPEGGDLLGEVGGDRDGGPVGAVGEAALRLGAGDLHEAVDVLLVLLQQGVRELRTHVEVGDLAVGALRVRARVLVHHGGGDLVQMVARVDERPGHVARVDQRHEREARDEQRRDRLLPLAGQQGDRTPTGGGGTAADGGTDGAESGQDGAERGRERGEESTEDSHHAATIHWCIDSE